MTADRDPDCLFCRIVAGEIPSDRVLEDDDVVAFRDVNPQAPTHVLVVPRRHVPDVDTLADDDAGLLPSLFTAVRRVAELENLSKGYRVVTNVGAESGQSVFHLHLHVLGGRRMEWPPG
ncbi:MAG TPA: histidine triad nucleotide-binding protein [Candidatus Limnocylindria bacterium]|jgi:histidine triad (HIT) family protein|nr:histidine triad nucleotide-binding protein [Candidatus Limnocylindria bacterium]